MSLNINNISKYFGEFLAVDNIDFSLEDGKMLGFLGRNGAGKTTTFRMILGLNEPSKGNVTFQGRKININLYDNIGYLPEERGLHTKLKVYDELIYMAKLKGISRKEAKRKIDYWLDEFQITENKNKKIENLSKGNQQKIQLLVSILHEPDLLILDEPFSGLDPVNVELLKHSIKKLKEKGKTIILSTHRMDHVEQLCDELIIIDKGKSILQGDIHDVKSNYTEKNVILDTINDITTILKELHIKNYKKDSNTYRFKVKTEKEAYSIFNRLIMDDIKISHFEISEPKIDEIFLNKVGDIYE